MKVGSPWRPRSRVAIDATNGGEQVGTILTIVKASRRYIRMLRLGQHFRVVVESVDV